MSGEAVTPTGGREPFETFVDSQSLNVSVSDTLSTGVTRGALAQTSTAKGKSRKR